MARVRAWRGAEINGSVSVSVRSNARGESGTRSWEKGVGLGCFWCWVLVLGSGVSVRSRLGRERVRVARAGGGARVGCTAKTSLG